MVLTPQCHLSLLRKQPLTTPPSTKDLHICLLINIDWSSIAQAFSPFTGLPPDSVSS